MGHSNAGIRAFSLIEMIAVLAVIAILAAATLPVLIRQIDYGAQSNEGTNLVSVASAFQLSASRQRYVPSAATWPAFLATNGGWQVSGITTNPRNNTRVFLVDPSLVIGATTAGTLPYVQGSGGASARPISPRFIIMSSLSIPFPAGVSSGVPSSTDFNALWSTPEDTIPTGTSWNWSNWKGQPADVRIQRINLDSSFHLLSLSVTDPTNGLYRIDNFGLSVVPNGATLDRYFLTGTTYELYARIGGVTNLVASQVLDADARWEFSGGYWRNKNVPAAAAGGGGGSWGNMIEEFLSAPSHNGMSPQTLFANMTNILALYNEYAASGFTNNVLKNRLSASNDVFINNYKQIDDP